MRNGNTKGGIRSPRSCSYQPYQRHFRSITLYVLRRWRVRGGNFLFGLEIEEPCWMEGGKDGRLPINMSSSVMTCVPPTASSSPEIPREEEERLEDSDTGSFRALPAPCTPPLSPSLIRTISRPNQRVEMIVGDKDIKSPRILGLGQKRPIMKFTPSIEPCHHRERKGDGTTDVSSNPFKCPSPLLSTAST